MDDIFSKNGCLWLNLCLTFYRMYYICRNVDNFVNFKTIFSEFYLLNINLFLVINRLKCYNIRLLIGCREQNLTIHTFPVLLFLLKLRTYFFFVRNKISLSLMLQWHSKRVHKEKTFILLRKYNRFSRIKMRRRKMQVIQQIAKVLLYCSA